MRIAFVTAELAPYAQVGGLADVARWLPAAMADRGHEVTIVTPHYDVFDPLDRPVRQVGEVELGPLGAASVSELATETGVRTLLVGSDRWFARGAIYADGDDEPLRFAALTRAVAPVCALAGIEPDVVHANDWHTALARWHLDATGLADVPVVLTIHNLAYQGVFAGSLLPSMGLAPRVDEVNSLREGIRSAAMVTTVSPSFAAEIVRPEHGMGLDADLRELGDRLVGILNGVGDEWDPATDAWIPHPYDTPDGKAPNTIALRERLGLDDASDAPILGVVGRMDVQKGYDIVVPAIDRLLGEGRVQLAALGRGDPEVEALFERLATDHRGRAAFVRDFDRGLGHLIEAGSDIFLMPSRFEPCGLNQMYSLAYGTIPIVHRTGGLIDSVRPWDGTQGTGFLFSPHGAGAFGAALEHALSTHADPGAWRRLMEEGMAEDHSWAGRAAAYEQVYERVAAR